MIKKDNQIRLLSISETAKLLSLRDETVKQLMADQKIRFIPIGKRNKIPYCELERFINENLTTQKAGQESSVDRMISKKHFPKKKKEIDGNTILKKVTGGENGNSN
ncbi:MAG: helix-turn-helix domain-containing protein [Melioribacteraceae bacterium]|nr:helix-turn-helix domain-containing protein [Melioribacteraceae bacterium]MCF8395720.1 helix-turn-helix domain-containing protein [Melioribacteraceae bacterium]MCF8421208.1 helix-turn-helix domain-containing protein [Melioribacteraceae bacterium]